MTEYGIPFRTGNILGLPGETIQQMYETVEMNITVQPYIGLANIFAPFPGLKLTQYAMEQGFFRPANSHDLPKDYFTGSMLNFSKKEKSRIYKLLCLFPLFVRRPFLFRTPWLRQGLFCLPKTALRIIYELVYTIKLARFSIPRTSLRLKFRMALRHIKNL